MEPEKLGVQRSLHGGWCEETVEDVAHDLRDMKVTFACLFSEDAHEDMLCATHEDFSLKKSFNMLELALGAGLGALIFLVSGWLSIQKGDELTQVAHVHSSLMEECFKTYAVVREAFDLFQI